MVVKSILSNYNIDIYIDIDKSVYIKDSSGKKEYIDDSLKKNIKNLFHL